MGLRNHRAPREAFRQPVKPFPSPAGRRDTNFGGPYAFAAVVTTIALHEVAIFGLILIFRKPSAYSPSDFVWK